MLLRKPQGNTALWCDGLVDSNTTGSKRKRKEYESLPDPKTKKHGDTHERVQYLVDQLKEQHASKFSQMQYRIWAELIHASTDDPPQGNSMFNRAGDRKRKARKSDQSPVAQELSDAATAITSASYIIYTKLARN